MDLIYRKATASNSFANCAEVAAWVKASYSGGNGGGCVEVTFTDDPATIAAVGHKADEDVLYFMRDSKNPKGPKLAFTRQEWDAFLAGVKNGEFDPQEDGSLPDLVSADS